LKRISENPSRRAFLQTGVAAAAAAGAPRGLAADGGQTFVDIIRPPDYVAAYVEGAGRKTLAKSGSRWQDADVEVSAEAKQQAGARTLAFSVASPSSPLERLELRWWGRLPEGSRFLGDQWERSYGDLEWRGFDADRVMPWYFLAATGRGTHGYGVKTGAGAFCFWQADAEGISLWLDVRNGGSGVRLGDRSLAAAEVVALRGRPEESPYRAACALCRALAGPARLPAKPLYGSNNWYYLYGENMTAEVVLADVDQLAELSPVQENAPYMVIDMGWAKGREGEGPWTEDHLRIAEVPGLPAEMKKRGVRPGIWVRPLLTVDPAAKGWALAGAGKPTPAESPFVIDPSVPDALAYIQEGLRRITGWGYELVKHDYSTFDILGRWGPEMGAALTSGGWHFADRSKTTAEIVRQFYRALREAVGGGILLGCNTVGHLGAGIFESQRTGDDTSGRDWNRTRKMGVNTMGFRMPQHRAFFLMDPDCAPVSKTVPLAMTRQWLDLVARSGAALFISANPVETTAEEKTLLKEALHTAARVQPEAEPLDWMETTSPQHWRLGGKATSFTWFGQNGVDFFST
jgi:alpha-galactosidase